MSDSTKAMFVARYGKPSARLDLATNHPDHNVRLTALNEMDRRSEFDSPTHHKKLRANHLTKIFETGDRRETSIHLDSMYLTWKHLDIISKHFPQNDWRNKDLYTRMNNKAKYGKAGLDANEV